MGFACFVSPPFVVSPVQTDCDGRDEKATVNLIMIITRMMKIMTRSIMAGMDSG